MATSLKCPSPRAHLLQRIVSLVCDAVQHFGRTPNNLSCRISRHGPVQKWAAFVLVALCVTKSVSAVSSSIGHSLATFQTVFRAARALSASGILFPSFLLNLTSSVSHVVLTTGVCAAFKIGNPIWRAQSVFLCQVGAVHPFHVPLSCLFLHLL